MMSVGHNQTLEVVVTSDVSGSWPTDVSCSHGQAECESITYSKRTDFHHGGRLGMVGSVVRKGNIGRSQSCKSDEVPHRPVSVICKFLMSQAPPLSTRKAYNLSGNLYHHLIICPVKFFFF